MYLIVGLGNPGKKYQNNRHNIGFMMVEYLLETYNMKHAAQIEFENDKYLNAEIVRINKDMLHVPCCMLRDVVLVKPQTFMNNSGLAVKKIVENYKLKIENLVVVHDDLDIPLGKFRIDLARGPKLHNGLESIEQHLKTKDFWRIRIGVDNRQTTGQMNGETYVLQDFLPEEKKAIENLFPQISARMTDSVIQWGNK